MESYLNAVPTTVFHGINNPNELPAPISEGIGKVLQSCSRTACFLKTVPLELIPGTNKIKACRSKFALAKFWLGLILIFAEASYALFKFVYVTHYDIPVTKFGYLYTGIMTGMYWFGAVTMLLTFIRRYELQEFINTITHLNQHAGTQKGSAKGISIMYLLMKYLPIGMYSLGAGNAVVFLASKNAPITIYSSLDPSYRDSWFILILHMIHDVVMPSRIITTILFVVLWVLGYLELVKLQCFEYIESNGVEMSPRKTMKQFQIYRWFQIARNESLSSTQEIIAVLVVLSFIILVISGFICIKLMGVIGFPANMLYPLIVVVLGLFAFVAHYEGSFVQMSSHSVRMSWRHGNSSKELRQMILSCNDIVLQAGNFYVFGRATTLTYFKLVFDSCISLVLCY